MTPFLWTMAGGFVLGIILLITFGSGKRHKPIAILVALVTSVVCAIGFVFDISSNPYKNGYVPSTGAMEQGSSGNMSQVSVQGFFNGDSIGETLQDIQIDNLVAEFTSIGFTVEEASDLREIFLQCGITTIDGCSASMADATIDGLVAYRAEWDEDRVFWFTIDHRELIYIALNGEALYDIDRGGFLMNANDVHIPESNVSYEIFHKLQNLSIPVVNSYLTHPDWSYYDGWGVGRADDEYMIVGEVYAQNGFGVKDWVPFKVWFTEIDGEFILKGVSIEGVQVYVR